MSAPGLILDLLAAGLAVANTGLIIVNGILLRKLKRTNKEAAENAAKIKLHDQRLAELIRHLTDLALQVLPPDQVLPPAGNEGRPN